MQETTKIASSKKLTKDGEIAKLLKMVEKLQDQINENEPRNQRDSVKQDDYIEVFSLCPMIITLTTEPKGRGFRYVWNNFGDVSQIVYSDLQRLIKNHGSGMYTDFFREGYIYINDKDVVRKSGFTEVYEKILSLDQMKRVLLCDSQECIDLFKSTNKTQQRFIARMLIERISNGEKLDLNLIDQMTRISRIPIADDAEETKVYRDMMEKENKTK